MGVQFEIKPEPIFEFVENNPTIFFHCDRDSLEYFVDNETWITMEFIENAIEFSNGSSEHDVTFYTGSDDYNFFINNFRTDIFAIDDFSDPNDYYSARDYIGKLLTRPTPQKITNDERKEENKMNVPSFDFGKVTNGSVVMSFMGLAIKSKDGRYLHYNTSTEEITDVSGMEMSNMSDFIYKMPVAIKDVTVSDLIVHNGMPMYVKEVISSSSIIAVDVVSSEAKVIIPVKNIFGFNFITKITSFINFDMMNDADESNPFGSSMLPFLLMGNKSNGNKMNDMLPLMMMMSGGKMDMSNPMMMMMFMGDGKMNDMLPLMMMMGNNPFAPKAKSE